ncbi:MAG: acyl carrier protein [Planctomycetes bacterium]|nr:acyl carrier protein [Planctomycetota bacterium]
MEFLTKKDIENKLIAEIALILSLNVSDISAEELLSSLGMDSLSFVELLVSVEKNFDLTLMNTSLSKEDFSTVSNLAKRIYETINKQ